MSMVAKRWLLSKFVLTHTIVPFQSLLRRSHGAQRPWKSFRATRKMARIYVFASIAWLVMTLTGNDANRQSLQLMTDSGGAALCAEGRPYAHAKMSPKMRGAPGAVRCSMTCTEDARCRHFNYVPTESSPCQLFDYRPTSFRPSTNCRHYYEPGRQKIHAVI